MKRRRRTEILINTNPLFAEGMRKQVEQHYDVVVVDEAENGLTMIKMRESAQQSLFYLGEVLMTEVKAQIGDAVGIGIIRGDEPERAYDLAVIDAAFNGKLPITLVWESQLLSEERRWLKQKARKQSQIMETQVNFDVMDA